MSTTTLPAAPPAGGRTPHPRRPVVIVSTVLAVVLLLAVAVAASVHAADAAALSGVRVFLDGRPLTCADDADVTTVLRGEGDGDESYRVPAVRGRADLDCRLAVVVQNGSGRRLDVQRVTFTLLGPESGVGLRTDSSLTQGLSPLPTGDGGDAVFDYARDPENRAPVPVPPGGVKRFLFHLVAGACRQAGATTTWDESPVFTATIGTATRDIPLDRPGLGFVGAGPDGRSCRP